MALGQRIVSELGLDEDRDDTLSRWMAHRIAELMREAGDGKTKAARQTAAKECESLILRVWERRTSWPKGWPPPTATKALERLSTPEDDPDATPFFQRQVKDDGERSWLGTLPLIVELHRQELDVWRDAGLRELDVRELADWLEQGGAELSAQEQLALARLTDAAASARSRLRRIDPRLTPAEQAVEDEPVARLEELGVRREALIRRATASKRKSHTKPRKNAKRRPSIET